VTSAKGYDVSVSTLGELHFRGFLFMECPEFWPDGKNVWTSEHSKQSLIPLPTLQSEEIILDAPEITIPSLSENVSHGSCNDISKSANLLTCFFDCVSRGDFKLTQKKTFVARSRKIIKEDWLEPNKNTLISPENILSFACEQKIVKIDSRRVVIPDKHFSSFRKKRLPNQIKSFLEYKIIQFEKSNAEYCFKLFNLRMLCIIFLKNKKNNWLETKKIVTKIKNRAKFIFSVQKGLKNWNWKVSDQKIPSDTKWEKINNELLNIYFFSTGAIEFGKNKKQSSCVRLTDFGRFWIQDSPMPACKNKQQQLIVQPDFTALLTHSGPLDRVAQVLSIFGKRAGNDDASVFSFSRKSVQMAIQHGHPATELLSCLNSNCTYSVPDNVQHIIQEWGVISKHVELFQDVNLFYFDSISARDSFTKSFGQKIKPIGTRYAIFFASENSVFNAMKKINALPVDYTVPPVGGIEIKLDGQVICNAPGDLRVIALRNTISEQIKSNFYLSKKVMKNNKYPKVIYDKLLKLPGKKFSLNARLNILVGLGLIKPAADNEYFIIDNLIPAEKRKLKNKIDWKKVLITSVSKNSFVIDRKYCELR